jgi:hypothetical protein
MVPKNPSPQNDWGINPLPHHINNSIISSLPPIKEGVFSGLWGQGLETDLPKQKKPKLPSENTFN